MKGNIRATIAVVTCEIAFVFFKLRETSFKLGVSRISPEVGVGSRAEKTPMFRTKAFFASSAIDTMRR